MAYIYSNARYSDASGKRIDIDFEHNIHGTIPMTITQDEYPELWFIVAENPIEPFTPQQESHARAAWRQDAVLSRAQFCLALKKIKLLPPKEAVAAAKGEWPPTFAAALAQLPAGISNEDAEIIWAGEQNVRRTHPLFEAMRKHVGMTPEQADELFGYSPVTSED